MKSSRMICCHR